MFGINSPSKEAAYRLSKPSFHVAQEQERTSDLTLLSLQLVTLNETFTMEVNPDPCFLCRLHHLLSKVLFSWEQDTQWGISLPSQIEMSSCKTFMQWKACSCPGKNISVCEDVRAKESAWWHLHAEAFPSGACVHVHSGQLADPEAVPMIVTLCCLKWLAFFYMEIGPRSVLWATCNQL